MSSTPSRIGTSSSGVTLAVALALLSGLALAASPWIGVVRAVDPAQDVLAAATPVALWTAAFALAVPVLAVVALARGAVAVSGALVAGNGAIAVGLAVGDFQLWTDALDANRFELFRLDSAAPLEATAGAYVVFGGHALAVLAGVIGLLVVQKAGLADGYGSAGSVERDGRATAGRIGAGLTIVVVLAAVGIVAALFAPAFHSENPIILVTPILGADGVVAAGAGALGAALLVVIAASLSSISPPVASGALLGAGAALLGVFGGRLLGGLVSDERLTPAAGTVWGAACALALVVAAAAIPLVDRVRDDRSLREFDAPAAARRSSDAAQSSSTRWHIYAGLSALAAAALAVGGIFLPVLEISDGLPQVQIVAVRSVGVAAAVVGICAVWLLLSEFAATVRPVVAVVWAAIPLTVAALTQPVLLAAEVPGVAVGTGMLVLWLAAFVAAGSALVAWCAGSAEREDIETPAAETPDRLRTAVGVLAALAFTAGFALPLRSGTDSNYTSTSFAGLPWDIDAWGQLLAATVCGVAIVVSLQARPPRAVALWVGVALLAGVHLVSFALTRGVIDHSKAGPGIPATVVGLVLSLVAIALTVRSKSR